MYTNIQQAVASVENAFPSIYTKDDVIRLLTSIEIEAPEAKGGRLTTEQVSDLCRKIVAQVRENAENLDSDCIDKDSAEFSLSYKEIELDSVEFDTREIANTVVDGIGDVIEEFFEELSKEEEV